MKKILNTNSLKIIAIITMVLDHIAYLFVPVSSVFYFIFRIIGRICAPVMFYSLANGFFYTRSRIKYACRLLFFAILSQVPYSLFVGNQIFLINNYNILFTLFLAFMCLFIIYSKSMNLFLKITFNILLIGLSYFCDYGLFGIVLVFIFAFSKSYKIKFILYSIASIAYVAIKSILTNSFISFVIFLGLFLAIPLLNLYNEKKGKINLKYLFYVFYPLHFIVLIIIKTLL